MKRQIGALLLFALTVSARAVTVTVSGGADVWLAGVTGIATASLGDIAPTHSPVPVVGVPLRAGQALLFSATGATDHCDDARCGLAGPEGDHNEGSFLHSTGVENGIADIRAPIDALIGVFVDSTRVKLGPTPGLLDFSTLGSRDFASLFPLLNQPFFIGDGLRNDEVTAQSFVVPEGATSLYLGTMDGFGWFNNVGSLTVTVETQSTSGVGLMPAAPASPDNQAALGSSALSLVPTSSENQGTPAFGAVSFASASLGRQGSPQPLTLLAVAPMAQSVPEPGTLALLGLGLGLAGIAASRRRKNG